MQGLYGIPRSGLSCFLFIYLVRGAPDLVRGAPDLVRPPAGAHPRYCTVLAYGRNLRAAETIAINRVHQQGLHIVRADTATAAPWLDSVSDADYLAELARYGCALRMNDGISGTVSAA
jgi:hypothetical protein